MKETDYIYNYKNSRGDYIFLDSLNSKIYRIKESISSKYKKIISECEKNNNYDLFFNTFDIKKDDIKRKKDNSYDELYYELLNSKDYLHLVILPTEKCNFKCIYCYENHVKGRMSQEIQDSVIIFVEKNIYKYKALRIEWFGGEPLCEINIINYISGSLKEICKKNKKPYYSSMTTNAYLLTPDVFNQMYKKNNIISYQITIDGIKEAHDKQRCLSNGSGTFENIINNLKYIRDNVKSNILHIEIRCNITNFVLNDFDKYVDLINYEFGNDIRFSNIWKVAWKPNNSECETYCNQNCLYEVLMKNSQRGLRFGINRSQLTKYGNVCFASKKYSYIIGSDAMIYKCSVALDDEKNQLGKLNKDGTMLIDEKKFKYWTERRNEMVHNLCSKCNIYPTCLGIYCNLNNVDSNGKFQCTGVKDYLNAYLENISRVDDYVIDLAGES